jgi:hypothetical protein
MPEHFVRGNHKKVILGQVERHELAAAIQDAKRVPGATPFRPDLHGQPAIFG